MLDSRTSSTSSPAYEVKAYCGNIQAITALADEWRELCEEGVSNEPFYRPEWFEAFLTAFKPDARLRILTVRRASRLRAVLPLVEERSRFLGVPCRMLRSPTNIHSNRFDICVGTGDSAEAVRALWLTLFEDASWDVLELQDVPLGGWGRKLLQHASEAGYPSGLWESMQTPYIPIPPGCSSVEKALGKEQSSFFSNLKKKLRKLEKSGPVVLERIRNANHDLLNAFYTMESAGWKGREGSAIAREPETRKFYDLLATAAARFGYLDMHILTCGGEPVGVNYAMTLGGKHFIPKTTYSEKFSQISPGQLLMFKAVEQCLSDNLTEMDFLGPWAPWKGHWTASTREHAHCYAFRRGLLGRTLWALKFQGATRARKAKRAVQAYLDARRQRAQAKLKGEGIKGS